MAKTKEELEHIKKEFNDLSTKLSELSEDELNSVIGGNDIPTTLIKQIIDKIGVNKIDFENDIKPTNTEGWFGNND